MEFIGGYLKSVRIKKRYKIKSISKELKISENILEYIEDDFFPEYMNTVYLIGHIRSYAKFLKLNENQIIENFKIQISYDKRNYVKEVSKPLQNKNLITFPRSVSVVSVLIIASSFYLLFVQPNDLQPNFAMTPEVPENLSYSLEEIDMRMVLLNESKKIEKDLIIEKNQDKLLANDENNELINSSSAIASLPNENLDNIKYDITLKFLNSTWVQLRDNKNNIILSKLMNKGDEYSYNQSQNLNLTAGNAGNIIITLDGIVKGKAGKAGEVIDSLIIDNNFSN